MKKTASVIGVLLLSSVLLYVALPRIAEFLFPDNKAPSAASKKNETSEPALSPQLRAQRDQFLAEAIALAPPFGPLVGPPLTDAESASRALTDGELVIGIEINGAARAYPLNMINDPARKVINDTLGDIPILVTWCDLCHTAAVFRRKTDDRNNTETFGCSGMLWNNSLVIYDIATRSFWNQIAGKCLAGIRSGEALEPLASTTTSWSTWKKQFPKTDCLAASHVTDYLYESFYSEESGDEKIGYAFWGQKAGHFFTLKYLGLHPVLNISINETPIVVVTDPANFSIRAYYSKQDNQTLTFEPGPDGNLQDQQTQSLWNPTTGIAVEGKLTGQQLDSAAGYQSTIISWANLHPDGKITRR